MFDADPKDGQKAYRESETFQGVGDRAVVAETAFGSVGMTICYDVRLSAPLYRALWDLAGVNFITSTTSLPSPCRTGKAHCACAALRARKAIETGAFIVAPGQTGEHAGGRLTYGHSLIVAPWGEVLADGGEAEGFVAADCDLGQVIKARQMIRALHHTREFAVPLPKA